MITIIFAPPRYGKTALMTKFLADETFNQERIFECKREIRKLNKGGFHFTYPNYVTASNYSVDVHNFGYSPRQTKRINPYRLGFNNEKVATHFLPPYCAIGIMEGQKYFNSRLFKKFPDWMSRFFEMHGHNHLDFFIDTQRPHLIDVNVRELSNFIDIQEMKIKNDKIIWNVNIIGSSFELDKYLDSGKKDYFVKKKIVGSVDILSFYNTREAKPLFYAGNEKRDFDRLKPCSFDYSLEGFAEYNKLYGRELPDGFYKE